MLKLGTIRAPTSMVSPSMIIASRVVSPSSFGEPPHPTLPSQRSRSHSLQPCRMCWAWSRCPLLGQSASTHLLHGIDGRGVGLFCESSECDASGIHKWPRVDDDGQYGRVGACNLRLLSSGSDGRQTRENNHSNAHGDGHRATGGTNVQRCRQHFEAIQRLAHTCIVFFTRLPAMLQLHPPFRIATEAAGARC